jgi:hypothetical protein
MSYDPHEGSNMQYTQTTSLTLLTAATALLLGLLTSTSALAQTRVNDSGFRDSKINDDTLLKAGRIELMGQSSGLYSRDSGAGDNNTAAEFSSLYINPEVAVGYMVLDEVQVRANLGWLKIQTSSDDVDLQDFNSAMGTVQGLYHFALPYGTAIYAGAGAGYFIGSTARPGPAEGTTVSNSTQGFVAQGLAGWLIQPGPRFLIRTGLRLDTLFSTETPELEGAEEISTTNIKMMGEFGVGLRF